MPREGILVKNPVTRLTEAELELIHESSMRILDDPGLLSYNKQAAEIFKNAGAIVTKVEGSDHPCWHIRIPEKLAMDAVKKAPSTVKLGARNPDNALIMKGDESRVYFITGSETNIWMDVEIAPYVKKDNPSFFQSQL